MNAAGYTTGWVNYANEPSQAALERSSQDAYDVIRLMRSKAAVLTVDDVARLVEFFLTRVMTKIRIDLSQKSTKLYSIYLFII